MNKYILSLLIAFIAMVGCQSADKKAAAAKKISKGNIEKAKEANDFLIEAAKGVYKEVELSRLAQQKASITKVREFAKNLVADYDKNIDGLKELAKRKKINIILSADEELHHQIEKLSKLRGLDFDKEYIKLMVKDHEEDIQKFRKQVKNGKDIETKAFASGKLNILTHHLDMARTLHDSMIKS